MNIFPFILQLIALVCLLIAMLSLFPQPRFQWGWAGLFFWLLSLMIGVFTLHATVGVH